MSDTGLGGGRGAATARQSPGGSLSGEEAEEQVSGLSGWKERNDVITRKLMSVHLQLFLANPRLGTRGLTASCAFP